MQTNKLKPFLRIRLPTNYWLTNHIYIYPFTCTNKLLMFNRIISVR